MKRVGRKDTAPELAVRRFLHANGLRFRVAVRDLPGTPDIVLAKFGTALFVHGCFWHGHRCAHGRVQARTNTVFWNDKIQANRRRDARKRHALAKLGWRVIELWECQTDNGRVMRRLVERIRGGCCQPTPSDSRPG